MQIDDGDLLFSKEITYLELSKEIEMGNNDFVIYAFKERVYDFYLNPVSLLNRDKDWFAAGSLCVIVIDLLARLTESGGNKSRFTKWLKINLGFEDKLSKDFYTHIRNGLVHEGRLTKGTQFSNTIEDIVLVKKGIIKVNPELLYQILCEQFEKYLDSLWNESGKFESFMETFQEDIERDLDSL